MKIILFTGANDDQEGVMFIRVEDDDDDCAIGFMGLPEATSMRDHLTKWIDWRKTRQEEKSQ